MAAVRQFNEATALRQIRDAFWREGYRATSIDDLTAATGLKRGSLYAAFGDKQAMFLQAYDQYVGEVEAPIFAKLDAPDVQTAIEGLFNAVVEGLEAREGPKGCMVAMTMAEAPGLDSAIEAIARRSFDRAADRFYRRFLVGQAGGELPAGEDLKALATFYAATMRSIATAYRLTGDLGIARDVARVAVDRIRAFAEPD